MRVVLLSLISSLGIRVILNISRKLIGVIVTTLIGFGCHAAFGAESQVNKTQCVSGFRLGTPDEAQQILVLTAKRAAVNELFGELITSSTVVQDFELTIDQIQTASVGLVRVRGNIDFFNGNDFGEVCANIEVFVTEQDFLNFEPISLTKEYCHADSALKPIELKQATRMLAWTDLLIQYEPRLQDFSGDQISPLLKRRSIAEEGYVPKTETFCARVEGVVTPIEVSAFLQFQQPTAEIRPEIPLAEKVKGKYVGHYHCNGPIEAYFDISLQDGAKIAGDFMWQSESGRVYGEVVVEGLYDERTKQSALNVVSWKTRGGGRYYGSRITFSEDFTSLHVEHFRLNRCDATYYQLQ